MIQRRQTAKLFCFFSPLSHCFFRTFSLRVGLAAFAVFDLIIGFAALAALFHLMPTGFYEQGTTVERTLRTIGILFATLGIAGGNSNHRAKIDLYYAFKKVEFFGIVGVSIMQWWNTREEAWEKSLSVFLFCGLRVFFDFYGTYVAWSSAMKLRSGGTLESEFQSEKPFAEMRDMSSAGYMQVVVGS